MSIVWQVNLNGLYIHTLAFCYNDHIWFKTIKYFDSEYRACETSKDEWERERENNMNSRTYCRDQE